VVKMKKNAEVAKTILPKQVVTGTVTRDGRPVVELTPVAASLKPARRITLEVIAWLDAHRLPRITGDEDAGTVVSKMRDEDER